MAIDLLAIENAIIQRLTPLVDEFKVQVGAIDIKRPVVSKQIFVVYKSTITSPVKSFNGLVTKEIRFDVISRFQELRTNNQAYPILAKIDELLEGYEPEPVRTFNALHQVREESLPSEVEGLYLYRQIYEMTV